VNCGGHDHTQPYCRERKNENFFKFHWKLESRWNARFEDVSKTKKSEDNHRKFDIDNDDDIEELDPTVAISTGLFD